MARPTGQYAEQTADGRLLSDERLIELYWQRDEEAIRATKAKYGVMLMRIAYNILHDRCDCEECENDTYLRVWNRIPPTRPRVLAAFVAKIMRDTAIDAYKSKRSGKRIPSELTVSIDELNGLASCDETPETAYTTDELGRLISTYVRSLPDRRQYIFVERYYLCATVESIADELGIGLATVHRETEKIKTGLRDYLERNGVYV